MKSHDGNEIQLSTSRTDDGGICSSFTQACAELRVLFAACFLIVAPHAATAQARGVVDLADIPSGALLCRAITSAPADSAAFLFKYAESRDSGGQRMSLVAYDSAGAPLYMTMYSPTKDSIGDIRVQFVAVRFRPRRLGERVMLPTPPPAGSTDSVRPAISAAATLSEAEISHVEKLANSFWMHRCKDSVPEKP